jgi:hypothetical protein
MLYLGTFFTLVYISAVLDNAYVTATARFPVPFLCCQFVLQHFDSVSWIQCYNECDTAISSAHIYLSNLCTGKRVQRCPTPLGAVGKAGCPASCDGNVTVGKREATNLTLMNISHILLTLRYMLAYLNNKYMALTLPRSPYP